MPGVMTPEGERRRASGSRHGGAGNQDGCSTLGFETGAEIVERADFFVGGDTSDDVAGEAAHEMRFNGGEIELPNDQGHNGGKRVAVVETERRHLVAAATKVHGFFEGHRSRMSSLPQLTSDLMAVAGRLMKRIFGLTKHGILSSDQLPGERLEPSILLQRHGSVFARLLLGFEPLKFFHPGTFEKAFPSFRIDRFSGKAILNGQSFGHQLFEERILHDL